MKLGARKADLAVAAAGVAGPALIFIGYSVADDLNEDPSTGMRLVLGGVFCLFWFVAYVHHELRAGEPDPAWLPTVALAGGIAWAGLSMAVAWVVLARESPSGAAFADAFAALQWKRGAFIAPAAAAFVAATSLAGWRARTLPRWLSVIGLVLSLVVVIGPLPGLPSGLTMLAVRVWVMVLGALLCFRLVRAPARTDVA